MQLWSIVVLLAVFAGASLLSVNMGLLGLAAAFVVGSRQAGWPVKDVLAGFPADLFVTLVGITYLFAIASRNGTIDRMVDAAAWAVGGRAWAMPWLMFAVSALVTAVGALSPAAVAIIAPIALRFATQFGLSPLMMGLMVIHGAQGGGFSPLSVYGGITNQVVTRAGLASDPTTLFVSSLAFNAAIALVVYLVFGALGPRSPQSPADTALPHETAASTDGAPDELAATARRRRREQAFTMAGLATLAIASLVFDLNVGFVAVLIALALAAVAPGSQNGAEDRVSWSTVLLVCGIITYIDVMQKLGTIDWLGGEVALFANPLLAALALCYVAGIVSAFASSTALLGILVPLAVPFMAQGAVGAVGMVSAIAVATTIVDTSPFSTNGALVVANAPPERRPALLRQLLRYSAALVAAGPLLAWLVFVVRP